MAESLTDILGRLETKIGQLTTENARLRRTNSELAARNRELEGLMQEADAARKRAELDTEYLAVSHKLADNPDTLVSARRHISRLIRNIDRCLDMLKE